MEEDILGKMTPLNVFIFSYRFILSSMTPLYVFMFHTDLF